MIFTKELNMKKLILLAFSFIIIFFFCSCDTDKKVGLYAFLVDDYSGDSIECIAYKDNESNINKLLTKYGTINVNINYDEETDSYEQLSMYNTFQTLKSDFTLNVCRSAYESDVITITNYPDLQAPYYLSDKNYVHISNLSCDSYAKKTVYIPSYSVAALFGAEMCENCFPEMY